MHPRMLHHKHAIVLLPVHLPGYLRLSTDVCDIKQAIGTGANPSYTEAQKIYVDGKNSFKSDGSIRTLRGESGQETSDSTAKAACSAACPAKALFLAFAFCLITRLGQVMARLLYLKLLLV